MGNAVQHRSTMVAKRRCDIRMKIPLMFRGFGLDIRIIKTTEYWNGLWTCLCSQLQFFRFFFILNLFVFFFFPFFRTVIKKLCLEIVNQRNGLYRQKNKTKKYS